MCVCVWIYADVIYDSQPKVQRWEIRILFHGPRPPSCPVRNATCAAFRCSWLSPAWYIKTTRPKGPKWPWRKPWTPSTSAFVLQYLGTKFHVDLQHQLNSIDFNGRATLPWLVDRLLSTGSVVAAGQRPNLSCNELRRPDSAATTNTLHWPSAVALNALGCIEQQHGNLQNGETSACPAGWKTDLWIQVLHMWKLTWSSYEVKY